MMKYLELFMYAMVFVNLVCATYYSVYDDFSRATYFLALATFMLVSLK